MEPLSIVIVDDEPEIANLMRLMLLREAPHLDIRLLKSGQECLEYLKDHAVDCILSDYQMPCVSGMELLKSLREQGNDVPFIFITGQGSEEIARNAFKNGANDYFTKDIGFAHFARIMNSIGQAIRQRKAEAAKRGELISRQAAEETLRESEAMFRDLSEEALVGVYLIQEEKFVYLNRKAAEILGRAREDLLSAEDIFETIHPEDRDIVRETIRKRLEGLFKVADYQFRIMRPDGGISFVEVLGSSTSYKGKPAIIGTIIDITERKQAEEKLIGERDRVKKIFDIVPSIMLVIAPDGTVARINRRGCEVLGYTKEEIIGRNWFDNFIPENIREEIRDIFRKIMTGDTALPDNHQNFVLTKSGEERLINWYNSVFQDEKKGGFFTLSSGEDITEKKKVERQKEDFYAMFTHDIRSSLTAILGYAELLISKPQRPEINEMLAAICTSGNRLSALLENCMTISKTEAGKLATQSSPCNVAEVLRKSYEGMEIEMKEKELRFDVELGSDVPTSFVMDQKLIVRAVSNLLQNSINYTRKGGSIVLKAFSASETGQNFLVIAVADTGIGIPAEELGNIFEKYYRSGRAAGIRGTGLGLAIVKAVAEAHRGRVEVESEPEKGSVFRLYIPAIPAV